MNVLVENVGLGALCYLVAIKYAPQNLRTPTVAAAAIATGTYGITRNIYFMYRDIERVSIPTFFIACASTTYGIATIAQEVLKNA